MKKWMLHTKRADFRAIGERFQIDPVIARVIRNRDIEKIDEIDQYLNGTLDLLYDPLLMKDMEQATAIVQKKISAGKSIRIIGDYDIDGVCSTYILYAGLCELGAVVDWVIPERIRDGYGINERLIEEAQENGTDTIITCDNGIAAIDQIAYARKLGMTVVVTDHHDIPFEIVDGVKKEKVPAAHAVVNPKQSDCSYPFKKLCGAAVAWKFVQALYHRFGKEEKMRFLPFAAIATVGDVMDLQDENRIIVREGLKSLRTTDNIGLQKLIEVTGLAGNPISAYHIGFVLGPCLNATGRLDTARRAVCLLLSKTEEEANLAAWELKEFNENRKEMTLQWTEKAFECIEQSDCCKDRVLIVFLPDCHESLAGIIAGRIRERYYKPTLVFTRSQEGVKASGRSIEAYNMFEELSKCQDLFTKFGGHPMAAGISMPEEHLDILRRRLNENTTLSEDDLVEKVYIDVAMPLDYLTEERIEQLAKLEPFGKGNPKPVFAERNLRIEGIRRMGKENRMMKLKVTNGRASMDALKFSEADELEEYLCQQYGREEYQKAVVGRQNQIRLSVLYYPSINEFRGTRTMQIVITDYCVIQS